MRVDLQALARAWLTGIPGAGLALHDALEESGGYAANLDWVPWNAGIVDLRVRGMPLTGSLATVYLHANQHGSGWRWMLQAAGFGKQARQGAGTLAGTVEQAKEAAEHALRLVLKGEAT